jgi:hypothetical protein
MHEAGMSDASRLALIPAFYLSKYDRDALSALGYSGFTAAFNDIGQRLGISSSSVKNKRDDFDPFHENVRAGWHQRPLGPSRAKTVALLDEVSFGALTGLVKDLLHSAEYRSSDEVTEIVGSLKASEGKSTTGAFVPRGVTGRRAEELFIKLFGRGGIPIEGELIDRREDGCGYDFLLKDGNEDHQLEVKGLSGLDGGILFTDKEWQTAQTHPNYKLFVAYNLSGDPMWKIIKRPHSLLQPTRQARTVVQISWQVGAAQLGFE